MIDITGYKKVSYYDLQKAIHFKFVDSERTLTQISKDIGVSSITTVSNIFNTKKQVVSDIVLTETMKLLKLDGVVATKDGKKNYYLKLD